MPQRTWKYSRHHGHFQNVTLASAKMQLLLVGGDEKDFDYLPRGRGRIVDPKMTAFDWLFPQTGSRAHATYAQVGTPDSWSSMSSA